jgi:hypothetical protein
LNGRKVTNHKLPVRIILRLSKMSGNNNICVEYYTVFTFSHNVLSHPKEPVPGLLKNRLKNLPGTTQEDASYDEIIRELAFFRMIERGLDDSRKGKKISNEEMKHRIQSSKLFTGKI